MVRWIHRLMFGSQINYTVFGDKMFIQLQFTFLEFSSYNFSFSYSWLKCQVYTVHFTFYDIHQLHIGKHTIECEQYIINQIIN